MCAFFFFFAGQEILMAPSEVKTLSLLLGCKNIFLFCSVLSEEVESSSKIFYSCHCFCHCFDTVFSVHMDLDGTYSEEFLFIFSVFWCSGFLWLLLAAVSFLSVHFHLLCILQEYFQGVYNCGLLFSALATFVF